MADSTETLDSPVYAFEWDTWSPKVESAIALDLMALQQELRHSTSGFQVYTSSSDDSGFKRITRMLGVPRTDKLPKDNGSEMAAACKLFYMETRPVVTYYAKRTYTQFLGIKQSTVRFTQGQNPSLPVVKERPLPPAMHPAYKPMPPRNDSQYILPPWAQNG